jgi:citrate lyase beta subunit
MLDLRPRRSVLYLPAANARAVAKARTLACDCVILDLEDAVAPEVKVAARAAAVAAVQAGGWGEREVLLRVNGLATAWSSDDFAAAVGAGVAGIVVPKIDSVADLAETVRRAGGLPVWAMIETPRGVLAADGIAAVPGVAALIAGMADLGADLRAKPGTDRLPLLYSLSRIVLAARAAGVLAFDGVFTDINDTSGCEVEALQGAAFGFDGKTLIHPSQIAIANRVFAPSAAEIDDARGLIAASEAALADGRGVTTYKGKLVEVLHVAAARRLLGVAARCVV